jgi:hypothetical protein
VRNLVPGNSPTNISSDLFAQRSLRPRFQTCTASR